MGLRERLSEELKYRYIYTPKKLRKYADPFVKNRYRVKDIEKQVEMRSGKGKKAFMDILRNIWRGVKP